MSSAGRAERHHDEPSAQVEHPSRGSWRGRSWWSGPWWTASPVSHSFCTRGKCSTGARGCPASSWAGARSRTVDVIRQVFCMCKLCTMCHGIETVMRMVTWTIFVGAGTIPQTFWHSHKPYHSGIQDLFGFVWKTNEHFNDQRITQCQASRYE